MNEELKNELLAELKAEGLEVTEETAILIVNAVFNIIEKSIPSTYSLIISPVIAKIKEFVLVQVDKIDGEVG